MSLLTSFSAFLVALYGNVLLYDPNSVTPDLRPLNLNTERLRTSYDFIIVGGGSSGSVLASRLSENPYWNVLLLEAGGSETIRSETPALWHLNLKTEVDWNYNTEPQKNACQGAGGICICPRGKVLGGSSGTNALIYTVGNPRDYDDWARDGNVGWSWSELQPYFAAAERQLKPVIQRYNYESPILEPFLKAAEKFGYRRTNTNKGPQTGFMAAQVTSRNGRRLSAARAYLEPVRSRNNLDIALHAHVTKVLFDRHGRTATGVEFLRDSQIFQVQASKEVILSAGAIGSPHILLLSGVGPQHHLKSYGIPLVRDLPVGIGLQDHLQVRMIFSEDSIVSDIRSALSVAEYAINHTGPLSIAEIESIGFMHSKYSDPNEGRPDVQVSQGQLKGIVSWNEEPFVWALHCCKTRPDSTGKVSLKSSDPLVHPAIDPAYNTERTDQLVTIEAYNLCTQLAALMSKQIDHRFYPLCKELTPECVVANYTVPGYHPTSSCPMGSVVDSQLRVKGMRNLRIVDASIMPRVISANTNIPSIMIGEKGSHLVAEFWKNQ